ncbi:helix-turn-helix domain-containing protein [Persicitalea jodogahamensis]|uniref:helix-turn-helix domain-containing protein n=1 Tax=Persicitalea jodogahamensis TaxID=402147 RepID=UPI00167A27B7|nr:hypothetical protein [Persicitalea jodogahamensis]
MSTNKPQHSCSENQQFISQMRRVVDATIDEQFASGNSVNFSDRISEGFGQEYDLLEALFFQIQDVSLEEYILTRKIEKTKEVLVYTDCPMPEIARLLDFDNVAHLTRILKKYTGYNFEHFVNIRREKRAIMDKAGENGGEKNEAVEVRMTAGR